MRRLIFVVLVLLLSGCDEIKPTPAPPKIEPKPPVAVPEGLAAEVVVREPNRLMGEIRDAAGGPALFLPRTVGGLVANALGLPLQAVERIDEKLPIVAATQVVGDDVHAALAVHVRDAFQLAKLLTFGPDAKFDKKEDGDFVWLSAKPKLRQAHIAASIALVDHYLVAGGSEAAVRALGPFLTRNVATKKAPVEDMAIDLHAPAFGERLRGRLEKLATRLDPLLFPPTVHALVDLSAVAGAAIAVTAKVDKGRVTVQLGGKTLDIVAKLEGYDGRLPMMDRDVLAKLPDDTVGALAWAQTEQGRRDDAKGRGAWIAELLGDDWKPKDTDKLDAVLDRVAKGRGDRATFAMRCTGIGVTGMAHGDVTDADTLREGLSQLVALRKHAAAQAKLKSASLKLSAKKTRILEVPHDVWRLRLIPKGDEVDERLEAIDLLYTVLDDRFLAAAGMETIDSVQQMYAPPDDKPFWSAQRKQVGEALARLPQRVWFAGLVDAQGVNACALGRPGGTFAAPIALAGGAEGDRVTLRLEIARGLIKLGVAKLFE